MLLKHTFSLLFLLLIATSVLAKVSNPRQDDVSLARRMKKKDKSKGKKDKKDKKDKSKKSKKGKKDKSGKGSKKNNDMKPPKGYKVLTACIGAYPGYEGYYHQINGVVHVIFDDKETTDFEMRFSLYEVESACTDCGIHIHEGISCEDPSLPGSHFYESDPDPWTPENGAVYNSDAHGSVEMGSFELNSGLTFKDNEEHVVIVHAQDGTRIGCGILYDDNKKYKECF